MKVGADGIAISADGQRLFYTPLVSRKLYSVSVDALADEPKIVIQIPLRCGPPSLIVDGQLLPQEELRVEDITIRPGDVVVIAGKGHETGQEFADRKIPFDDREILTLLSRVATEAPRSPREIVPAVPRGLAAIVLRCLAKARGVVGEECPFDEFGDGLAPVEAARVVEAEETGVDVGRGT